MVPVGPVACQVPPPAPSRRPYGLTSSTSDPSLAGHGVPGAGVDRSVRLDEHLAGVTLDPARGHVVVELDLELARAVEGAALDQVVAVVGLAARGLLVELEGGPEAELVVAGIERPAALVGRDEDRSRGGGRSGVRREPHRLPAVRALAPPRPWPRRRSAPRSCTAPVPALSHRRRRPSPDIETGLEVEQQPAGGVFGAGPMGAVGSSSPPQPATPRSSTNATTGASLTTPPPDSRSTSRGTTYPAEARVSTTPPAPGYSGSQQPAWVDFARSFPCRPRLPGRGGSTRARALSPTPVGRAPHERQGRTPPST